MSHHGWSVVSSAEIAKGLRSPFGRLFPPGRSHSYNSLAISLLSGALGPLQNNDPPVFPSPMPENKKPSLSAGFTFLGQFIDHDMTEFRVVSPEFGLTMQNPTLGQRQKILEDGEAPTSTNGRSAHLDLDSVYGVLDDIDLALFDDKGYFKTFKDESGRSVDILRNQNYKDGRLIADPRNDENKIIVQLHVLFERLHDKLHVPPKSSENLKASIAGTRKKAVEIYRKIVLYDYLSRIANPSIVLSVGERIIENRSLFQKSNLRARRALRILGIGDSVSEKEIENLIVTPVEFAHAAFRLGHSQIRDGYRMNSVLGLPLFTTGAVPTNNPPDLRGNASITKNIEIEWKFFFGNASQPGEPIDATLSKSLFRLPPPSIGEPPISLAERNIRRGIDFGLPSGQEIAQVLNHEYGGVATLRPEQIIPDDVFKRYPDLAVVDESITVITPLWFYILRESQELADGDTFIGPVGSYIVAETILGSLYASPEFDLKDKLTNYISLASAARNATKAENPGEITSVAQLLHFLGEPGF